MKVYHVALFDLLVRYRKEMNLKAKF